MKSLLFHILLVSCLNCLCQQSNLLSYTEEMLTEVWKHNTQDWVKERLQESTYGANGFTTIISQWNAADSLWEKNFKSERILLKRRAL